MKNIIWIVTGDWGWYDDRTNWIVGIFTTEELAKKRISDIKQWVKENPKKTSCPFDEQYRWETDYEYDQWEITE